MYKACFSFPKRSDHTTLSARVPSTLARENNKRSEDNDNDLWRGARRASILLGVRQNGVRSPAHQREDIVIKRSIEPAPYHAFVSNNGCQQPTRAIGTACHGVAEPWACYKNRLIVESVYGPYRPKGVSRRIKKVLGGTIAVGSWWLVL